MNAHLQHTAANMGRVRRLHFIGIGGAGMSGIAELMANLGYEVSGSDLRESEVTRRLAGLGVEIHVGHRAEQVVDVDAVVVSTAIDEDNPEIRAARAARIPIVRRAEMLAELMRFYYGVAVAGTHGKTTTTSLVASILAEGGLDPTFVIGGRLNSAGANAKLGTTKYLVAEADESDASFLYLQPMVSIVTNIDADHMHTYGNDFSRLRSTFVEFLHHLPFYGLAVLCIDDPVVRELVSTIPRPVRTYGTHPEADVRASALRQCGMRTSFRVESDALDGPLELTLNLPGRHNVLNALAAITVALELGVEEPAIARALSRFEGVGRRFVSHELRDAWGRDLLVVDDYGHHPRELAATLEAARAGWPGRRLVLVFQPHRYSRTQEQFDDFVAVLSGVDALVLCEVYPAGEQPIPGADGRALSRAIRTRGECDPVFVEGPEAVPELLPNLLEDGDIVLVAGAGDIGRLAARLPQLLEQGR
ncbi:MULTISPECIES: UDP-N-acetylmuramate--L-alanine ligase [Marichromatium]|uniref:UDP-N-acetylmuramate--L-alanine ligase n=1 Tax=Marichromatium gracile TaxID=1048 RepID=A0A4R4AGI7_MARGR|nr:MULTISPECIES: UDP-N-acetylmuramate--L-alanine ligase [Marichromatium]MBO8084413.1 UDP-N-acetylmuramate--L-alanine ligase [Marichromatium sp.]MBK1709287.1 UDP-N-acetylmuramate--L-alanine ligase [Marichromatium gracile]RNE90848.1 UDP-N-acetylmuramate--L-alanine ligase [Marichromatium sp. AB31]RNE94379.1 UDP-N-acetylmuramate--L-alanine ligase [Marichromatium sp. AB32]TCW38205.1 UDP-N-acetylmuramate--L-alanine ligase [Marichromatium gracile]